MFFVTTVNYTVFRFYFAIVHWASIENRKKIFSINLHLATLIYSPVIIVFIVDSSKFSICSIFPFHLQIKLYYFSKINLYVIETRRISGFFFAWPGHVVDKEEEDTTQNKCMKGIYIPGFHNPCNFKLVKVLPGLLNWKWFRGICVPLFSKEEAKELQFPGDLGISYSPKD